MKEDVRSMWWVLFLTFCGLFTAFMIFAYYQTIGDRENREGYAKLSATRDSLHSVYRKLMMGKTYSPNNEALIIRSEDMRRALARGTNNLGELPAWANGAMVYIAREGVPLNSQRFICFVSFGKRLFPLYGLTSTGECRYTEPGEVRKGDLEKDFISLGASK